MADAARENYPGGLNKRFRSKFRTDLRVQQKDSRVLQDALEEGQRLHRPKRCDDNIQDENSSLNDPNKMRLFLTTDAHGDFSCAQCDSRKDNYYGECERYPPDPTPCPKNSRSMFCSIVREIDFEGIQLLFSRGCATTYLDERCIVKNVTNGSMVRQKNVCFRTCVTSGCNSESLSPRGASTQLKAPSTKIAFFVFLTVYISSCHQFATDQIN